MCNTETVPSIDRRASLGLWLIGVILISALPPLMLGCAGSSRSGTYRGTCDNQTVWKSADLIIVLIVHDDAQVTGTINITGDLVGSGEIKGVVDGNQVSFTSMGRQSEIITWVGRFSGSKISGSYVVDAPRWHKTGDQKGIWSVSK